jgi:hypothetical protein
MFFLRWLPPELRPYFLIALGLFLILVCTVFFQAGERLQDRMATNEKNRRDWTFRKTRLVTLWLRRHTVWRDTLRAIATAVGIFGVAQGLWLLFA